MRELNSLLNGLQAQVEELKRPTLKLALTHPDAKVPTFSTDGAAGMDFYSTSECTIPPGGSVAIGLGVAMEIPEDLVLLLFSRSGSGFKYGIRLANSVGVVDSDFRGEIKAKLNNDSESAYAVKVGDRVAQGVLMPHFRPKLAVVNDLSITSRGTGGFGSTGQ